jgi:hypothetical protein
MRAFLRRHVIWVVAAAVLVLAVTAYLVLFVFWGVGSGSTGIGDP